MNTTTATNTRAASSKSAVATSSKFRTFAITFSIVGTVLYCLCVFFNWPMFTFHPATNRVVWGYEAARSGEGPNMLWYGWTATTVVVSAVFGIIATMLPDHVSKKIPVFLLWLLPILSIPYIIYSLMPWWTHP
jgi:hypothetical protein